MNTLFYVERITKQTFIVYSDSPTDAVLESFNAEEVHLHLHSKVFDQYGVEIGDTDDGHTLGPKEPDLFETQHT